MAEPKQRLPVSAIITTFNEEHNIADCIRSLEWCDEIIVVDSFSEDRTTEIVKSFPQVRLLQHTYYGSAAQKNWAMDRVEHEWILIFDADERCTPNLRDEIEKTLKEGPKANSYRIRRTLYFLDKKIRFCGWHSDAVVRLIKKGTARYPNRRVHADMITTGPTLVFKHPLDHFMIHDPTEYIRRITKYGIWGASQLRKEGKTSGPFQFVFRPLWRLVRSYFLQLGFLDGYHGIIFCIIQAYGTFVKWGMVWCWQQVETMGLEPKLPDFDDSEETWKSLNALTDETEEANSD